MSAHVLLNLSNEFGQSDKLQVLPSILSLFCSEIINCYCYNGRHYVTLDDGRLRLTFIYSPLELFEDSGQLGLKFIVIT